MRYKITGSILCAIFLASGLSISVPTFSQPPPGHHPGGPVPGGPGLHAGEPGGPVPGGPGDPGLHAGDPGLHAGDPGLHNDKAEP